MSANPHVTLLSPAQVGELVGVKPETVRGWIKTGRIPAVNIASGARREPLYRIAESDLLDWIEAQKS